MRDIRDMEYHTGCMARIYLSYRQMRIVAKSDGAERFVYNKLVALNNELYLLEKVSIYTEPIEQRKSYIRTVLSSKRELMNTAPFLDDSEIDSLTIDNAYANYRASWNLFKKNPSSGKPVFHKKGYSKHYNTNPHYSKDAIGISDCNVRLSDRNHIQLPKLGKVRFSASDRFREILTHPGETRIGRITISMDAVGRYYVSMQVGSMIPFKDHLPQTSRSAGYDLGIHQLYTDSDGNKEYLPDYYKRSMDKLTKNQKILSRRMRRAKSDGRSLTESKNYQRQRIKVALIHDHTANQRKCFLNNCTLKEVKNHDFLYVEDISAKQLLKEYAHSGHGYMHNFARALSDRSWGMFTTMLEYKSLWYGRTFLRVPHEDTSQTCSSCGYILSGNERLDITQTKWTCPQCGATHDRDHNAAKIVLQRGFDPLP